MLLMSYEGYQISPAPGGSGEFEEYLLGKPVKFDIEIVNESLDGEHARAAEIAGEGNYAGILDTLRREGLLAEELNRVEREYALEAIPFLDEKDREMFTVLDLYDPSTARHCLETYLIAREKMEKEILHGVSLERLIADQEGVTLDQFYRACLLHDIGKVEVPRAVICNTFDDGLMLECLHHVYHRLYNEGKIPAWLGLNEGSTEDEIDRAFKKQHSLRCVQLVPAREVLSPIELAEIMERGYTGDETIMDMIKPHETRSGEILARAGYPTESQLSALHHNYENKILERPLSVSLLHIADVTQALRSGDRPYKTAFSMPKMMRIIAEHAREGKISPVVAYLWLTDDLRKYDAEPHDTLDQKKAEQDSEHLAIARSFVVQVGEGIKENLT